MKILLQNIKNGKRTIEEIPYPAIKQGRIIVDNHYSAISIGTEKMITELASMNYIQKAKARPNDIKKIIQKIKQEGLLGTAKSVLNKLDEPMTLGYSASGIVSEVGNDISEFKKGDRVAIGGGGFVYHGEVCMVPSNLAVKLPDNVLLEDAAFTTIAAIGVQGMRVANIEAGDYVCVIGLGLLGLITAQILIASGCMVYGIEPDKNKRNIAEKLGVIKTFDIDEDNEVIFNSARGRGFDKIIITASSKNSVPIETAGIIARDRGIISVIGATGMNISRNLFYSKELTVKVSRSYGPGRGDKNYEDNNIDYPIGYVRWTEKRNMEFFIDLLSKQKIDMSLLKSKVYDFENAVNAYDELMSKSGNALIGVLFKYTKDIEKKKIIIKNEYREGIVNLGIIGAGNFVKSTMLPFMKKTKKFNFIGIVDRSGKNSAYIANKFAFNYATSDYKKVINDNNINLIAISTNHSSHSKLIIEAMENGKDVYCEKPIAIKKNEIEEIKKVIQKTGKRLYIGYNRRFSPHIDKIKKYLANTQKPYNMVYIMNAGFIPKDHWINRKEEGGRIIGEACHIYDLFIHITNSNVRKVNISRLSGNRENFAYESEASINIEFEDGSVGTIIYSGLGNKNYIKEQMKIFADGSIIEMNNYRETVFCGKSTKKYKTFSMEKGFAESYTMLANAIEKGEDFPISLNELFQMEKLIF